MIGILYSADYELFLGGNHLPEERVLIDPCDELLATARELGIPLTLFVDIACLWRYRELGSDRFPDAAESQLIRAVIDGHDVQTHLHPHWPGTRFDAGRFHFDPATYLAHGLGRGPKEREARATALLARAAEHFTRLFRPHRTDYRCVAFRAGGYALQPEPAPLLAALRATGHRIDSSILPGATFTNAVQQVDFTRVPSLPNYWISPASGLENPAPAGEGLFEIPIATCRTRGGDALRFNASEIRRQGGMILSGREQTIGVRGTPCTETTSPAAGATTRDTPLDRARHTYWRTRNLLRQRFWRLELLPNPGLMLAVVERYLAPFAASTEPLFFSLNCHPKAITPDHLRALAQFHRALVRRHGQDLHPLTFRAAADQLGL
ncbi:MAG: hypothetical protein HQL57_05795 [Magnetococcales bacterium]|nr:hypothetical protein [Magnetococcales bacterium]MBF0156679.1 hypothetical protein [Magnetococcales bacterium]